jgi:hypothetical protein
MHIPPTRSPRPRRPGPSRWPGGERDRSCHGACTGARGGRWMGHRGPAEHHGRRARRRRPPSSTGRPPANAQPRPPTTGSGRWVGLQGSRAYGRDSSSIMPWRAHSHSSRKIRRSAICCPSGLSWSCRITSARTSLGGGQDPKEVLTRRWSERVSEASRVLPKHRGARVSASAPRRRRDGRGRRRR